MSRHTAKTRRRTWARRLHLCAGLTLGLYLVVMSLTGALLVFGEDLERALSPSRLTLPPGDRVLALDEQVSAFRERYPEAPISRIVLPEKRTHPTRFWVGAWDGSMPVVSVDPYRAEVLGERAYGGPIIGWVRYFHYTLYAGMTGMLVNGILGLATLILLASGLYLWWPSTFKLLRRRVWVKWRGSPARRNWDLHHAVGFWALPLLILLVLTGAAFPFMGFLGSLVTTSPPLQTETDTAPGPDKPTLDQLVQAVHRAVPGGRPAVIYGPEAQGQALRVLVFEPGGENWYRYAMVAVDRRTGQAMDTRRQQTLGDQALASIFPLHTGRFFGVYSKALWVMIGLAPAVLLFSGVKLTLKRQGKRIKPARRQATQAESHRD